MKKLIVALLLPFFLVSRIANAEPTEQDAQQIIAAVTGMFEGLHKGDTQAVFDLQTADTKQLFGDAEEFGHSLRQCCFALHSTVQAKIVGVEVTSDTEVAVAVLMIDNRNYRWGTVFILMKEGGGMEDRSSPHHPA